MLTDSIEQLITSALQRVNGAATLAELEQFRVQYLGKQGEMTAILKQLKQASAEEKKSLGMQANLAKKTITQALDQKLKELQQQQWQKKFNQEAIDVTLPGRAAARGGLHPITLVRERAVALLAQVGFSMVEGPEIEDDYHNFEALNIPKDHPARAMQDTFYFADGLMLRTHTSSVQVRVMQRSKPPLRIITPGRVYRRDSDQTHSPMFHQLECLMVDQNTNILELQALLRQFLQAFFGMALALRFRPSYFQFTEPSFEVDIAFNKHSACVTDVVDSNTKWLEVLGCGMVHPNVLRAVDIDSEVYLGFAFGVGLDRLAMLRYGVSDLRMFFENDIRFLSQFDDQKGVL